MKKGILELANCLNTLIETPHFEPEELEELFEFRKYKKKEFFLQQNDPAIYFAFVVKAYSPYQKCPDFFLKQME